MKLKKLLTIALAFGVLSTFANQVSATQIEEFTAQVVTSVYDPTIEQEEIDPNEALSGGMSRSTTGEIAKIEQTETGYNVTVRLLMQSSAKDVVLTQFDGQEYQVLDYNIVGENEEIDSIDYQFETTDPYAPIGAEMFVIPMERTTQWFIGLDEETISNDLSLFEIEENEINEEIDQNLQEEIEEKEEIKQETVNEENSNQILIITALLGVVILIGVIVLLRKR